MPLGQVTHSPDVSLKPTPGKIRYLRLNYLLVSGGTAILRKLLQNLIFPKELSEVLNKPVVFKRLDHLRKKGIIFDKEWQLLYPTSASCQPTSFDITLLTKILKEKVICSLSKPRTGWNNLPNQADLSLEADIVRIHQYRNITCHINEKMEIRKSEFLDYWKQIKDALLRIVGYHSPSGSPLVEEWEKTIDDLMTSPLDADEDQEGSSFCNYLQQLPTQVFSLRCMIKLASVGAWLGGTIYALNRLKDNPEVLANFFQSTFNGGISVIRVEFGTITLQLRARDLLAMEELRKRYESGQLTKDLQKCIITEDLKHLANGEPVEFTVEMDEDEYLLARQYLSDNQETNDDTLCTTAKTVRKEEEDNLNEESTNKTVSMEEEEDNLSEGNTDKTVSLKEEEDNLNEESTDKTVSLKEEEDNLNEESTDKTVSMEEEEDNLSEESTNKTVSMEEEEDNLSKGNTDKTVSLEKEKDNLNEENTSFFKHSKMALSSTKTSLTKNAISQFHKICTKIALELVTRDVKALKYLTLDKVPGGVLEEIKAEEEYSGLKWFACLTKHKVICEYNVEFLIEALEAANRHDLAKKAKEYQDQMVGEREELAITRTRLISKSIFYTTSDCVHLFFAVEMGYAAGGTNMCKRMVNASQKALNTCCKEPVVGNMELALIKFGNHGNKRNTNSSAPRGQESNVAILVKEVSKDLNMGSCPNFYSFCGGRGGTSGIADALAEFVDIVQRNEMQRQIPKICILICFISKECSDLEYFRCPEGKDAIKLCNILAEYAIPLYIIGIDHAGVQACARGTPHATEENPFLSGITFIGGGQYFQVSDVNHVEQAINCIIKENMSIEEHMGTVNDIVIIERNKEGGNLNVEHLAEHLRENLNLRSCTVDNIKLNNESPQAISQIVQRVAWADDLNDAINAVKSWREQNESLDRTRSIDFSLSRGSRSFSNYSAVSQYSCESFSSLPTSEMQAQNQQTLFPELKPNSASSMSRSIFSSGHTSTSGGESASFQSLFFSTTTQNLQMYQPMEPSLKPSTRRRKRKAEHTTTTRTKRPNDSESTKNNSSSITLAEGQKVGMDVARRMVRRQITRQAYYQRIK